MGCVTNQMYGFLTLNKIMILVFLKLHLEKNFLAYIDFFTKNEYFAGLEKLCGLTSVYLHEILPMN